MLEKEADRFGSTPHPRRASTLIGHHLKEHDLLEAYRNGRLPHAIIIGGQAGIGKATLAWRLVRFLLANPDPYSVRVREANDLGVPTDSKAAAQVASLSHPDLILLRRETNEKTKRFFTEIRADDVRGAIGVFQRAAGAGGYRVCVVDSAEDLNRSSANALLKIIEEPPPASLFLLIAHRPGLVMPTIRSRAHLVRLSPLGPADVSQVIASLGPPWSEAGAGRIEAAAALADGSVHAALRAIEEEDVELGRTIGRLLDGLPDVEWRVVHSLADKISGRDGEPAYELTMTAVFNWLDAAVRCGASREPRRLAPYAEVWDKVAASERETDALNLDKRPMILSMFSDLAAAVRASSV